MSKKIAHDLKNPQKIRRFICPIFLGISLLLFSSLIEDAGAEYNDCKVLQKRVGGAAADYKFEATAADGKKTTICVKGQTLNENAARTMCKNGDYDGQSDCKNW
jgi:hypothetical protein